MAKRIAMVLKSSFFPPRANEPRHRLHQLALQQQSHACASRLLVQLATAGHCPFLLLPFAPSWPNIHAAGFHMDGSLRRLVLVLSREKMQGSLSSRPLPGRGGKPINHGSAALCKFVSPSSYHSRYPPCPSPSLLPLRLDKAGLHCEEIGLTLNGREAAAAAKLRTRSICLCPWTGRLIDRTRSNWV